MVLGTSSPPSAVVPDRIPARAPQTLRGFPGRGFPRSWLGQFGRLDLAWVVLWLLGLVAIVVFERWESIPFHLIWISFALLYGFRIRRATPTFWVLAAMVVTTAAAVGLDVMRGTEPAGELPEVPLMAAMVWVMMWHARRSQATGAEHARLLSAQVRFLQDASHQLRTPITIALGHAELLARSVADQADKRDIYVVVGELNRLRRLSERLLLIAAAENPEFLRHEPVELDRLGAEVLRRWEPTAARRWQLGPLDAATAQADTDRLRLALDALLENAVQHTGPDDTISLSVQRHPGSLVGLVVQDSGAGIPAAEIRYIFDRFRTVAGPGGHAGTGLGLALVQAVARGHGGEIRVQSTPGQGSRFELLLPEQPRSGQPRRRRLAGAGLLSLGGPSPGRPDHPGDQGRQL